MPGAEHTACTVEMVNMQRRVDVAVIDEIQMIGDETRCGCHGFGFGFGADAMGSPACIRTMHQQWHLVVVATDEMAGNDSALQAL